MRIQYLILGLIVLIQACGSERDKENDQIYVSTNNKEYDWKIISESVKNKFAEDDPPDTFFAPRDPSKIIKTKNGVDVYKDRISIQFDIHNPKRISTLDKIVKELNATIIESVPLLGGYTIQVNTSTFEELKVIVDKLNDNPQYPGLVGSSWALANIEKYMIFEDPLPQGKKK